MNLVTVDFVKGMHLKGHGPCPDPQAVCDAFNKAAVEHWWGPKNVSCFFGQMCLESNEFKNLEEEDSGEAYEGRIDLGNVSAGDGKKYKGRGWIQLTGRENYALAGTAIGCDLVNQPTLALEHDTAAKVAIWFWMRKGLASLADQWDVKEITHRINGGFTDYDVRLEYTLLAKHMLIGDSA